MSDATSLRVDPALLQSTYGEQRVLLVEVARDDLFLLASEQGQWLRTLRRWDWRRLRPVAAQYYQALWDFNQAAALERQARRSGQPANPETRGQATLRLVAERPTAGNAAAANLAPLLEAPASRPEIRPDTLSPGVVPFRLAGKPPKCFFALTKAFIGVQLMGKAASASEVAHHLKISPPLARACGFTLPRDHGRYRRSDIPSQRKLEQFEQIMSESGLWTLIKIDTVNTNLADGTIDLNRSELVYDTTHFIAFSQMQTVEVLPPEKPQCVVPQEPAKDPKPHRKDLLRDHRRLRHAARAAAREAFREQRAAKKSGGLVTNSSTASTPTKRRGRPRVEKKTRKKSHPKTIKRCRCADRDTCPHPWVSADSGAGTVVKSGRPGQTKQYWAHKAAVLSTAGPDGIPLDAVAMTDAASHDSTGLFPQLERVFQMHPLIENRFDTILADTAMDDLDLKDAVEQRFGLILRTQINPRNRRPITKDLGGGMKRLSPSGTLTCRADREMNYRGVRFATEEFLYGPPENESGVTACATCPLRDSCCQRPGATGRHVAIPFAHLAHIDPSDPPMAKRFKALMRHRTAVERSIKRLKLDFGNPHLKRRGTAAFQSHLDRSMIALHLSLRH